MVQVGAGEELKVAVFPFPDMSETVVPLPSINGYSAVAPAIGLIPTKVPLSCADVTPVPPFEAPRAVVVSVRPAKLGDDDVPRPMSARAVGEFVRVAATDPEPDAVTSPVRAVNPPPPPEGVFQVPSPKKHVVDDAPTPPFICETEILPKRLPNEGCAVVGTPFVETPVMN